MTAETAVLPSPAVPIVKEDGRVDDTWYQRLRSLASATNTANTAPPSASAKTGDYTAVVDDRASFITMTGASTLTLDAAATLGDTWWIAFANIGSRRITINPDGAELIDGAATVYLYPGQRCFIFCNGTAFYTIGKPARWKATALTVYVATTGSDSNDGLDVGSPLLTIQTAVNFVLFEVDTQNTTPLVQLADGTYDQRFSVTADGLGSNQVEVRGHVGTDTDVVLQPTSGTDPVIYVKDKGIATVTYMTVASSTASALAVAEQYAVLDISLVVFGACSSGVHVKALGHGRVNLLEDYRITGAAVAHLQADRAGIIEVSNAVVTISGVLAYTYFALGSDIGHIHSTESSFSGGTVTGQRYLAQLNSVIHTETAGVPGGANYFPGSIAGATATGGQYL